MRLLFLTGSLNQGGAEFQILALAQLFKERGHEVEVFALTDHAFYKPFLIRHGITYTHVQNKDSKLRRLWLTRKVIRGYKPDVIIAYLRVVGQMALFAKALSLTNTKVLIGERTSLSIPFYDTYYFNLLRAADWITVNSQSKLRYIQQRYPFLGRKTFFFSNIIDLERFQPNNSLSGREMKISFVGRLSPEKNVVTLIRAVILLRRDWPYLRLALYGDSRDHAYKTEIESLLGEDPIHEDAIVLEGKSNEMEEIYKKTSLLCLISDFEGFSNVISEALCCGIPVVASDIEENRYLIDDGVNGFLVNQKDVMSVANGIRRYLNLTDEQRRTMSRVNREKAERLFDSEGIYNEYISILNPLNSI